MEVDRRARRRAFEPDGLVSERGCLDLQPLRGQGPAGAGLVGGGGAVGQPFPGGVGPQVADGTEDLVRRVEVELDQSLAPELELESVHRHAVHVAIAPDLVPPAGVLGGRRRPSCRRDEPAGSWSCGSRTRNRSGCRRLRRCGGRRPGRRSGGRRRGLSVQPCQSAKRSTRLTQRRSCPSSGSSTSRSVATACPGPDGVEELGPGLDAHGREVAAGREADARHVVVEAEAVLPPPVGSDAEGVLADLARRRTLGLGRPGPAVLEASQEPLRELGSAREVEGVDSRRQLPERWVL